MDLGKLSLTFFCLECPAFARSFFEASQVAEFLGAELEEVLRLRRRAGIMRHSCKEGNNTYFDIAAIVILIFECRNAARRDELLPQVQTMMAEYGIDWLIENNGKF